MEIGQFHSFLCSYSGMNVKIQRVPCDFFQGLLSQGIFFQGVNLQSLPFSGWQTQKLFQVSFFFQGIELSKIKFQGIYESNNHSFQGVLVLKNLVVHTPVYMDKKRNSPLHLLQHNNLLHHVKSQNVHPFMQSSQSGIAKKLASKLMLHMQQSRKSMWYYQDNTSLVMSYILHKYHQR